MHQQERNETDETDNHLLLCYLRGTTSPEENIVIEKWINQTPENEKIAMQIGQIYYAQYTRKRIESYNPYMAFERNRIRRKHKKLKRILKYAGGIAACISFIISLTVSFLYTRKEHTIETQYVTICTNPGVRTNFNLPDGTLVYLNSASKLIYPIPYHPDERRVCLEGEAYFEVESDKKYPFIVSVAEDKMRVKVTGTSFNITAYPEEKEIYTTLVEGAVDIQVMNNISKKVIRTLKDSSQQIIYNYDTDNLIIAQRTIKPMEKVTFNKETQKVSIKTVVPDYEYAWKDGKLIFKDTPLPEVLRRMSSYYNVKFEVKDPVIETYRFTGTFQHKQLSQVLDYLQQTNKIKYTIKIATEDDSKGIKYTLILLEKKE